jgi:phospholipid/cholesterol/gamma-HCH transport system substrate-binding protein
MKKENTNYFMVGLFVISGFLLLLIMLFKITGNQSDADEYFVEFSNVTGIKDGVVVTYGGYAIGAVNNVQPLLENGQMRYKLSLGVKSGWRIPADSSAQIVMPAIISDKQIEITQGQAEKSLQPGDTIQGAEAVDVMELVDSIGQKLNSFIPESTKNVNKLLQQLNFSADQVALLLSQENVNHLNSFFKNADSSSQNLSELTASFSRINKQLDSVLDKTNVMLGDNSDDIRYSIIELKKSMDVISGRIESVMYNLDATSQNMNEFSRTLRNNPGAILGSTPPTDIHGDK